MSEHLTIQTPDGPMGAYLSEPAGTGPKPAVLVLQEAFGVNDHIRSVCDRIAARGYVALAPELFHRTGAGLEFGYTDFGALMPVFGTLTNAGLHTDIAAALATLRGRDDVDPSRIGVVGFCVGGFATLLAAEECDAATFVSFYGGGVLRTRPGISLTPIIDGVSKVKRPILFLYGGTDQSIPAEDVSAIDAAMRATGVTYEVVTYPDAGHGFACEARDSFHQPSNDAAWARTFAWFERYLGAGAS